MVLHFHILTRLIIIETIASELTDVQESFNLNCQKSEPDVAPASQGV